ncbi:lower collar protein [Vibrio phage VPMS1]|uniref:lower collar protein n=1 Tax=Vibrio phage VPMS1 TaxID=1233488 RepID=UPI0003585499|nr:lower collar protein [Vibrio phage VPMS1]AFV51092.1 lower collar protein [Vibrio phage VPMS1]
MPMYQVPSSASETKVESRNETLAYHAIAVAPKEGTATAGTVTVSARAPGSDVFEAIPDGAIDLSAPETVLFTFPVAEYKVVVSGFAGTATTLLLQDTVAEA